MKRLSLALAISLAVMPVAPLARAAQQYPDHDAPNSSIGVVVIDCLDSAGKAVPITSGLCAGTVPTSGGSGSGGAVTGADPCFASLKTTAAFSSSSGQFRIITGTASKKTYICHIDYRVGVAVNVSVIEGTGSNCATGSTAMDGSTTAANGKAEAANGGEAAGNGSGDLMHAATVADDVCILQSGTALIAGRVSYVQQ